MSDGIGFDATVMLSNLVAVTCNVNNENCIYISVMYLMLNILWATLWYRVFLSLDRLNSHMISANITVLTTTQFFQSEVKYSSCNEWVLSISLS